MSKIRIFQIAKELNLSLENVVKISSKKVKLIAQRPLDMRMDTTRFEQKYMLKLPKIENEIYSIIDQYCNE